MSAKTSWHTSLYPMYKSTFMVKRISLYHKQWNATNIQVYCRNIAGPVGFYHHQTSLRRNDISKAATLPARTQRLCVRVNRRKSTVSCSWNCERQNNAVAEVPPDATASPCPRSRRLWKEDNSPGRAGTFVMAVPPTSCRIRGGRRQLIVP